MKAPSTFTTSIATRWVLIDVLCTDLPEIGITGLVLNPTVLVQLSVFWLNTVSWIYFLFAFILYQIVLRLRQETWGVTATSTQTHKETISLWYGSLPAKSTSEKKKRKKRRKDDRINKIWASQQSQQAASETIPVEMWSCAEDGTKPRCGGINQWERVTTCDVRFLATIDWGSLLQHGMHLVVFPLL